MFAQKANRGSTLKSRTDTGEVNAQHSALLADDITLAMKKIKNALKEYAFIPEKSVKLRVFQQTMKSQSQLPVTLSRERRQRKLEGDLQC